MYFVKLCFHTGRDRNEDDLSGLLIKEEAKEYLEIVKKNPAECIDTEKNKFLLFVEIGLAALNKHLWDKNEVKRAFLHMTESDYAWALANFRYYAGADEPEKDENLGRKTAKGNDSKRKYKRQKVATKKDVKDQIAFEYYSIKGSLALWNQGMDVADEEARKNMVAERKEIREAWAEFLYDHRNEQTTRENVAPSNSGAQTQAPNRFHDFHIDMSTMPKVAI